MQINLFFLFKPVSFLQTTHLIGKRKSIKLFSMPVNNFFIIIEVILEYTK